MPNAQALVNKLLEAGPDDDPNQYVDWLGKKTEVGPLDKIRFGVHIYTTDEKVIEQNALEAGVKITEYFWDEIERNMAIIEANALLLLRESHLYLNDEGHDDTGRAASAWLVEPIDAQVKLAKAIINWAEGEWPSTTSGTFENAFGTGSTEKLYANTTDVAKYIDVTIEFTGTDALKEWVKLNLHEGIDDPEHYVNRLKAEVMCSFCGRTAKVDEKGETHPTDPIQFKRTLSLPKYGGKSQWEIDPHGDDKITHFVDKNIYFCKHCRQEFQSDLFPIVEAAEDPDEGIDPKAYFDATTGWIDTFLNAGMTPRQEDTHSGQFWKRYECHGFNYLVYVGTRVPRWITVERNDSIYRINRFRCVFEYPDKYIKGMVGDFLALDRILTRARTSAHESDHHFDHKIIELHEQHKRNRQKFLDGRLKEGLDEPEQYLRGKAYTLYELRDRLEDNGLYFPNGGIFPWGRWAIIHGFAYWAVDKLEQPLPQSFFREQLEKVCKELGFTIYHIQLKGNFPNQISFKLAVPKMQVDPEAYEWQERRLNDPDFASSRRTFNKTSRGWLPEAEIPVPDPDSDLNVNPERYVRELTGLKAIDYSRREPEYGHNWLVFDVYRRKVGRIGLNHEDSTRWGWITVERPRLRLPDDVWINDYATKEELLQAAAPYVVPPRVIESTDPDDPSINIERHTDNLDIDAVMNKLGFVKRDEFNIWYKTKALKEWRVWPTTSDNVYGVTCMVRVSKKYDWVEKNSFTCHVTELEQMLREEGALKEALDPDAPEANIDDPDPYIKNFPIPVKAEIVADMNPEGRASFDATPWFDQATFEKVAALAKIGFQGNYAADDVGEFFFETTLRDWYKNYDGEGFEVYVDEADARRWLEHNHPDWYAAIWPDEVQESVDDPTPEFIHSAFDVPAMLKNRGYEKSSIGEQWSKVFRRVANGLDLMIVVNRRGFGGEKDEGDIIYDITLYRDNQKREWEPFGYKYGRNNKQLEQSLKSLEERVRKNDLQDDVDIDLDIDESVPEPPADDPDDPSMTLAAHTADLPELEPHQNPVIHKHAHGQLDELKAIGFTPSHIALKHTVFGEEEIPGFWSKNYPTFAGRVLFIHLLADDDGVMMSFRTRAIPAPGITLQPRSMAHIVTIVKELDAVMEQSAREKMPPEAETQALREIARKHSQWCRKPAYESVPEPPADPDDPQAFIQRMETDFRRILDKYGFKHGKGVYAGFYTHYYPDKVWGRPCRVTVTPGWFDFDEYVKANWPADVPTDCTYLDANEFDCFDDNVENPCASCRTYTELEKAFNNHSRADDFPDTMTVYIGNTASLGARFPASKLEAFLSRFTKAADKLVGTETKEHGLSYLLTNAAKQAASEIQEALEVPDPDDPSVNVERHTADLDVETILKRYGFEKLTPYQWERTLPTGFRIRVYPADVTNTTNQFALVRYDPNDLIRERVRFHASALKNALLTAGVPPVIEALEVPEPDPDDPSDVIRSHEHSLFPAELKRLEFEAKPKQGTANVYGNEMPRYWVKFYKAADGTTRALNLYLIGGQTTEVRANNWNFVAKSWFQHGHDWSDSPAKNEPHLCAIVRDLNDAMKRSAEDSLPPDQEHESIRRILKHHRQWWDDTLDYLINTKGGTIPGQIGPGEPA